MDAFFLHHCNALWVIYGSVPFSRCPRRRAPAPPAARPTRPPSSSGPAVPPDTAPGPSCRSGPGGPGSPDTIRFDWPCGSPGSDSAPCAPWTGPETEDWSLDREEDDRWTVVSWFRAMEQTGLVLLTVKEVEPLGRSRGLFRTTRCHHCR